jgi:hypothetical protein
LVDTGAGKGLYAGSEQDFGFSVYLLKAGPGGRSFALATGT